MSIELNDGSTIAIIGGGPAGSMCAFFLLTFADRMDLDLKVDIYEPRDFSQLAPGGCNMCGGIVSESLIQYLATEGINIPDDVVQRGIDSYELHTEEMDARIETPLQEMRIAAVHRGGGPRDAKEVKWSSFDGFLLKLAEEMGATVKPQRVTEVGWDDGRPQVIFKEESFTYDLLIGAVGVNSSGWKLFEKLGFGYRKPETVKTYITELNLGYETISELFGSSMHVFLTNLPRVDFAAIIPKGEFATAAMLGEDIDQEIIDAFFNCKPVRSRFHAEWEPAPGVCHCSPKINMKEVPVPYTDRVVLVGDCGASRLYKDGIGAAYRTAKAAALTAVFEGVSKEAFKKYFMPAYRRITFDNRIGFLLFAVIHFIHKVTPLTRGTMRMVIQEQSLPGHKRRMSILMWNLFTGSAPYREVLIRSFDPRFWLKYLWFSATSLRAPKQSER
jgi:flavin-dependent dehydrogenase